MKDWKKWKGKQEDAGRRKFLVINQKL